MEETKRILQARRPQANHSWSIRPAGERRNQKERERSPSRVEGQDLEEHQRVLQEEHHRQSQDMGGKEGTGHLQEANHRNARPTRSRKDKVNADSKLSTEEKNARRTVGPPRKETRGQKVQSNAQGKEGHPQKENPTERRMKSSRQVRAPPQ